MKRTIRMDGAQVADIKKLILDVVTALQGINEEAFSAYLYARETLIKLSAFHNRSS